MMNVMNLIASGSFVPGSFVLDPFDNVAIAGFSKFLLRLPNIASNSVQNRFIFVGFSEDILDSAPIYPVVWTEPVFFAVTEISPAVHMNASVVRLGLYCISSLRGRGESLDWELYAEPV